LVNGIGHFLDATDFGAALRRADLSEAQCQVLDTLEAVARELPSQRLAPQ